MTAADQRILGKHTTVAGDARQRIEPPPRNATRVASKGHRPARIDFTVDLAALVLAAAAALLTIRPDPGTASDAVDLIWSMIVIATVLLSLFASGAWDGQSRGPEESGLRDLSRGYGWAIASLAVCWSALGVEHKHIWILCTLPIGLSLSALFRKLLTALVRHRGGVTSLANSVIIVGDRTGVSTFVAQCRDDRRSYWNLDAVCLADKSPQGLLPEEVGTIPVVGADSDLFDLVYRNGYQLVVLLPSAGWEPERVRQLMWQLEGAQVKMMLALPLVDVASKRLQITEVSGVPLLHLDERPHRGARHAAKAAFDRVTASLAIAALLPILALIALTIRVTSKGPALYRQTRAGKGGRHFTIYKFRTMVSDAENMVASLEALNDGAGPLFKCFADPRVTPVGRFLRRYSIDELPQLFNVALGSMSLIGPRPPLPAEVQKYSSEHEHRRLLVRPGITGLWQVNGRSDLSWEETIRHDLYYVENWSVGLDVDILWRTMGAVASGRGAY